MFRNDALQFHTGKGMVTGEDHFSFGPVFSWVRSTRSRYLCHVQSCGIDYSGIEERQRRFRLGG